MVTNAEGPEIKVFLSANTKAFEEEDLEIIGRLANASPTTLSVKDQVGFAHSQYSSSVECLFSVGDDHGQKALALLRDGGSRAGTSWQTGESANGELFSAGLPVHEAARVPTFQHRS